MSKIILCEACGKTGLSSKMAPLQLNMHEALLVCENSEVSLLFELILFDRIIYIIMFFFTLGVVLFKSRNMLCSKIVLELQCSEYSLQTFKNVVFV